MSKRFFIVFALVWTAAIGLAGFSMLRPDGADDAGQRASSGSGEQAGQQQTSQQNSARDGENGSDGEDGRAVVARSNSSASSGGPEPGRVTLKLGGEPGISFSGRCEVDGEARRISGETPETFTYEPGERLECEITGQDGPLRVTFSDGEGTNTTQTVGPGASTLELTYTGDSFMASTRSNSQMNSSSQTSSSQVSSSQSISQQSSSSVTQSSAE